MRVSRSVLRHVEDLARTYHDAPREDEGEGSARGTRREIKARAYTALAGPAPHDRITIGEMVEIVAEHFDQGALRCARREEERSL